MLDNQGITEEIRKGMIYALVSQARPIHKLLAPNLLNQESAFKAQFQGMTDFKFTYADFESTRRELLKEIANSLAISDKEFLISFTAGQPNWEKSGIPYLEK